MTATGSCCSFAVRDLTLSYERPRGAPVIAVNEFSYSFRGGRIYVIMGSNGSGKTSLMRALAGEFLPARGVTELQCDSASHQMTFEYMPQDYRQAIFPWKRVVGNVSPWQATERVQGGRAIIEDALRLVGLNGAVDKFPYELSGGQQQLLLIARALVSTARITLLDEPFSALDVVRRTQISQLMRKRWLSADKIVVCTMHEPYEAVNLGDEILIMSGPPLAISKIISRADHGSADSVRAELLLEIARLASEGDQ